MKKGLLIGGAVFLGFMILIAIISPDPIEDKLNIGQERLDSLIGYPLPDEFIEKYGNPDTIGDINNIDFYSWDTLNISIGLKKNKIIIAEFGKKEAMSNYQFRIKDSINSRKKLIDEQFMPNGQHLKFTLLIEKTMNEPKSFEHVKTIHEDKGDYIIVQMTFRGKNGFNATITNTNTAKYSIDGTFLGLLD